MTNGVGGVGGVGVPGVPGGRKKGGSVEIGNTGIRRGLNPIPDEVAQGLTMFEGVARLFFEGWVRGILTAEEINNRLAGSFDGRFIYEVATDKDGNALLQQRGGETSFFVRTTPAAPVDRGKGDWVEIEGERESIYIRKGKLVGADLADLASLGISVPSGALVYKGWIGGGRKFGANLAPGEVNEILKRLAPAIGKNLGLSGTTYYKYELASTSRTDWLDANFSMILRQKLKPPRQKLKLPTKKTWTGPLLFRYDQQSIFYIIAQPLPKS